MTTIEKGPDFIKIFNLQNELRKVYNSAPRDEVKQIQAKLNEYLFEWKQSIQNGWYNYRIIEDVKLDNLKKLIEIMNLQDYNKQQKTIASLVGFRLKDWRDWRFFNQLFSMLTNKTLLEGLNI